MSAASIDKAVEFAKKRIERSTAGETVKYFELFSTLIQKRLWHELSMAMLKASMDSQFVAQHDSFEMFEGFTHHLKLKIDSVAYLQLLFKLFHASKTNQSKFDQFLAVFELVGQQMSEESRGGDEGFYYSLCQLQIMLQAHSTFKRDIDQEKMQQILRQIRSKMNDNKLALHDFLKLKMFYVLSQYYEHISDYEKYYTSALAFLHLVNPEKIAAFSNQQQSGVDFLGQSEDVVYFECERRNLTEEDFYYVCKNVCLSALVAKNLFSFGEILRHPVAKYLMKTPEYWIIDVIEAFNSGQIEKFKQIMAANASGQALLGHHAEVLSQKIGMMSLLNLAYNTGFKHLTFEQIAQYTNVEMREVELLVIRCISSELLSATINQTEGLVTVHSVKPRILTQEQMVKLSKYLVCWAQNVNQQLCKSEQQTGDVPVMS